MPTNSASTASNLITSRGHSMRPLIVAFAFCAVSAGYVAAQTTQTDAVVRLQLGALLGTDPNASELNVRPGVALAFHPGARVYIGEAPGLHGKNTAMVATTPEGIVLPLGCDAPRRVLQAFIKPIVPDSLRFEYAAVLAGLDGRTNGFGKVVLDSSKVPRVWASWARKAGVELPTATITSKGPVVEVRMMVMTDALFLVTAWLRKGAPDLVVESAVLLSPN
jgi:hypothetical protein